MLFYIIAGCEVGCTVVLYFLLIIYFNKDSDAKIKRIAVIIRNIAIFLLVICRPLYPVLWKKHYYLLQTTVIYITVAIILTGLLFFLVYTVGDIFKKRALLGFTTMLADALIGGDICFYILYILMCYEDLQKPARGFLFGIRFWNVYPYSIIVFSIVSCLLFRIIFPNIQKTDLPVSAELENEAHQK